MGVYKYCLQHGWHKTEYCTKCAQNIAANYQQFYLTQAAKQAGKPPKTDLQTEKK